MGLHYSKASFTRIPVIDFRDVAKGDPDIATDNKRPRLVRDDREYLQNVPLTAAQIATIDRSVRRNIRFV